MYYRDLCAYYLAKGPQERDDPLYYGIHIPQLAFPHGHSVPPAVLQGVYVLRVALAIAFQLRHPVIPVVLRNSGTWTPIVHMPKAAIDEQRLSA